MIGKDLGKMVKKKFINESGPTRRGRGHETPPSPRERDHRIPQEP